MIGFLLGMLASAGLCLCWIGLCERANHRAVERVLDRDDEIVSDSATVVWNRRTEEWGWIDNDDRPLMWGRAEEDDDENA